MNVQRFMIAVVSIMSIGSVAHATTPPPKEEPKKEEPRREPEPTKANASAGASAGANVGVGVNVGSSSGPSSSAVSGVAGGNAATGAVTTTTGPSTATSTGGQSTASTGASTATTGASAGGSAGSDSHNVTSNRLQYVNMPSSPGAAQPVVGSGSLALPSPECGPLREIRQIPIEYVAKRHGRIEKFTLAGQFTEVEAPVQDDSGKVKLWEVVDNGDGTFTEWGTSITKGGLVISNSVSSQTGLSLFGSSGGGNASTGTASATTGVERMLNLGRCMHRTYGRRLVETPVPAPSIGLNAPKVEVLSAKAHEVQVKAPDPAAPKLCAGKPLKEGYQCTLVRDKVTVVTDVGLTK